jgi:3'-phosphoadenosine 5'-phosphosulfate synthase
VALCAFVSPYRKDRELARRLHQDAGLPFLEVFVDTSLAECENRDTKGLYKKARAGIIKGFTGIDQPYERPDNAEVVVDTVGHSVPECVQHIVAAMRGRELLPRKVEPVWDGELTVPPGPALEQARAEAEGLPAVEITEVDLQWVQVLGEGWARPLKGFMREKEFLQSQHFGCLLGQGEVTSPPPAPPAAQGPTNQSVPVVLAVSEADKARVEGSRALVLRHGGRARAILRQPEFYPHRKEERCARQFGTTNPNHPYIKVGECSALTRHCPRWCWRAGRGWWAGSWRCWAGWSGATASTATASRRPSSRTGSRSCRRTPCSPSSCATPSTTGTRC